MDMEQLSQRIRALELGGIVKYAKPRTVAKVINAEMDRLTDKIYAKHNQRWAQKLLLPTGE